MKLGFFVLPVLVGLISQSYCHEDDFEVELDPESFGVSRQAPLDNIQRQEGIPDARAVIGKVFEFKIPSDAFRSSRDYFVKLSKKPDWLHYKDNVLQGVAQDEDAGHHYVSAEATQIGDYVTAKDVFDIHVVPAADDVKRDTSCKLHEGLTILTVVLGNPVQSLSPKQKVKLLKKFAKIAKKDISQVWMSESPASFDPLSDGSAVSAGAGSAKLTPGAHESHTQLQMQVGCGGKVSLRNKKITQNVEKMSRNGQLQAVVRLPVVGWHISMVDYATGRFKRDTLDNFSGDYYDYTNYDDDYDEYDQFFDEIAPVNKETDATENPTEPPDVEANYISPVVNPVPYTTKVPIPVKPDHVTMEVTPTATPMPPVVSQRPTMSLESSFQEFPSVTTVVTTPLTTPASAGPHPTDPIQVIQPTPVPELNTITEYGAKNFAPVIKNRIPKLGWVTGNVYRMKIPAESFEDPEDGGTRNLSLVLKDSDGKALSYDSWIQFNSANQEIYALPLEKEISRFDLQLEAIDSGRKSTVDKLIIRVTQPKEARNFNHEFSATLKLEQKFKHDANYALDWQVRAVEKVAELYNSDISSINVRNISSSSTIHLSWTNVTLVDSTSTVCPEEELQQLAEVLVEEGSRPTSHAKTVFMPEFQLKHAKVHFYKSCSHLNHRHKQTQNENDKVSFENQPPVYRNQIDQLHAHQGQLFTYKVQEDTCYDFEDGGVAGLNMRLLTTDLLPPPNNHWLQFDKANREFYGLPGKDDVGKRDYLLECKDSLGKKVDDALEVVVSPTAEDAEPPVEFQITLDANYHQFVSNVDQKVSLVRKLAKAFGDSSPRDIRVSRFQMGSVKVHWTNSSLPSSPCPREAIESLRSVMTDDNGDLKESFKAALLPAFTVTDAQTTPMGHCLSGDTPTHAAMPDVGEPPDVSQQEESGPPEEDYLLTFIIPAVLIALMLILAGLVAWCLWRRRRYAKLSLNDERTFVSKGVPVIFAEELDDQHSDGANVPVIMKEEKPPLPPPEYQRHSPGMSSTPPRDRSLPPDHGPYQPPHPPYASTNGSSRNSRPNMPPAYRKPPTYVPP